MQRLLEESGYTIQDGSILIFRKISVGLSTKELQNGYLFKLGDPSKNHIDALIQRDNRLEALRIGVQKATLSWNNSVSSLKTGAINIFSS